MNFIFNIKTKHQTYKIEVADDRDFSYITKLFSAGNTNYPNVRFIRVTPKEIIGTENAILPTSA